VLVRIPKAEFSYASSSESVKILERDIKEAVICFKNKAYKGTMVLCGSALECALLDYLSVEPKKARQQFRQIYPRRKSKPLEKMTLEEMLQVCRNLQIISAETFGLCDLLRNYRNLIHPSVIKRKAILPNKQRAHRSLEAVEQALGDMDSKFKSYVQTTYVINIANVPGRWITNKTNLQNAVANMSQAKGLGFSVIDSFSKLEKIVRRPPKYAIIVNAHGEIMPTPPSIGWRDFYRSIGNCVKNAGWVFVSPAGYPFWAFGPQTNQECQADGLNVFLSGCDASADCMNPAQVEFTQDGYRAIKKANMTGLPHRLMAQRCARWTGVLTKKIFLKRGDMLGASAVRMGRGWFIHLGFDSSLGIQNISPGHGETILGNLSIAFALYIWGLL
jgi:hypothetical protein